MYFLKVIALWNKPWYLQYVLSKQIKQEQFVYTSLLNINCFANSQDDKPP